VCVCVCVHVFRENPALDLGILSGIFISVDNGLHGMTIDTLFDRDVFYLVLYVGRSMFLVLLLVSWLGFLFFAM